MILADWQQRFTEAIQRESNHFESMTMPGVSAASGPGFQEGLSVYQNNYQGSRVNVLIDIYPVCFKVLGEECFLGLANVYVKQNQSLQPDLNLYGDEFSLLLQNRVDEQEAFFSYPWLADLARLEFACHEVYYFPDPHKFDEAVLVQTVPTNLKVESGKHIQWLETQWTVIDVWLAHQYADMPENLVITQAQNFILVDRQGYSATPEIIEESLFDWLEAANTSDTLDQFLNNEKLTPDCLSELISHGWVELEVKNV